MDLDLPIKEAYAEITRETLPQVKDFIDFLDTIYPIPNFIYSIIGQLGWWLDPIPEKEFLEYLVAYSEASGFSFGQVYFLNYLYENLHHCTSVITKGADGTIAQGRSWDFPFSDYIEPMLLRAEYYRGGKLLYSSITIPGYAG